MLIVVNFIGKLGAMGRYEDFFHIKINMYGLMLQAIGKNFKVQNVFFQVHQSMLSYEF